MFAKFNDIKARRAAGEKGFTLVELLVVVVIIAVLAAIAIPIFLNQKTKATESANQATVSALAGAMNIGMSTGGSVALPVGSIVVTDGTGASVTVPLGGAVAWSANELADTALAAGALTGASTFCFTLGGFHMSNGDTGPSAGTCEAD